VPCLHPIRPAGKRDLPAPLRNRFTEMWVGEPPQVRKEGRHLVPPWPLPLAHPTPLFDDAILSSPWRLTWKLLCGPPTLTQWCFCPAALPACLPAPQREDLAAIVAGYLSSVVAGAPVEAIVDFYLAAKAEAVSVLCRSGEGGKEATTWGDQLAPLLLLQCRPERCCPHCTALHIS
jgi:hypothetical protein